MDDDLFRLLRLLLARLERISADSISAHRASGVRGAMLRLMEQLENGQEIEDQTLQALVKYGFQILEDAAREKL